MTLDETVTGDDSVAITGTASAGERTVGVKGIGDSVGVKGEGKAWNAVEGISHSTIGGAGVFGANDTGAGVRGQSKARFNPAVHGIHTGTEGRGIIGEATDGTGAIGTSGTWVGVYGETNAPASAGASAIWGEGKSGGDGVKGHASGQGKAGVAGFHLTNNGPGIFGSGSPAGYFEGGEAGTGVFGHSTSGEAVHAETHSLGTAAIAAYNLAPNGTGAAVYAKKEGSIGHAGFFDGDVHVTRSVTVEGDVMLQNADCAEEFTIADPELAQPGTVMVIGEDGDTVPCASPYDHRVIGVVSGAGDFRPALLLDRQGGPARRPIALMGKVLCRVDADHGAIRPGDLLTTSTTPGHAMRARDATRAPGAMIGKALAALDVGLGAIPILAILQ